MTCIDYFYYLLARREYSAAELLKKAQEKGFDPTEISQAIADLQQKDYQSDSRLVATLIASGQGKYGKSVLKRKCFAKGIPSDVFEQVWSEQATGAETEQLSELKAKVARKYKIEDWDRIDPKTKGKLVNYLQYRGFNPFAVLGQWQREQEEEIST
jgi:regulatory protein